MALPLAVESQETMMSKPPVCCVIGAGDATGSAIARRFAREGYTVCVARRTEAALKPLVEPNNPLPL